MFEIKIYSRNISGYNMQKKCSKCGRPIKEVGKLVRVTWLGFRAPLCKKCREDLKKKQKSKFNISRLIPKWKK